MSPGLGIDFVFCFAPMVSAMVWRQSTEHPPELVPAVREVQRVAPLVRTSHCNSYLFLPEERSHVALGRQFAAVDEADPHVHLHPMEPDFPEAHPV